MSEIGTTLTNSVHGLAALEHRLKGISSYLDDIINEKLPVDNEIIGITQSIFNLLPNLELKDTVDSLSTKSDDSAFMIFISQLCRSVVSLHELVNENHKRHQQASKKETTGTEEKKEGTETKTEKDK